MSIRYDDLSDEELIEILREGDEKVTDYLMNKYKELVRNKAKSMFILGGDNDDLIQEGMIGLFKAVRDYDPGRDASFNTFAQLCVSRQMYTAIEASQRKKHAPLNSYVSFDLNDESLAEGQGGKMQGLLFSIAGENPEDILIDEENSACLEKAIMEVLSPLEKQVLNLKFTGMDYSQIAKVLGKEEKSIDNALSRIKTKVKKVINADN